MLGGDEAIGRGGRWSLDRRPESVTEARTAIRSFLGASISRADALLVLLVVTELVANAVQHGEEPIELRVSVLAGRVHIEVDDAGIRQPVMPTPAADGRSGRGLAIVESLGRWGCTTTEGSGKTVWCDVYAVPPQRGEPAL